MSECSELCLVSQFRMPLYPPNLCVENKLALSNEVSISRHYISAVLRNQRLVET